MLVRSYPFADFFALQHDLDRVFERTFGPMRGAPAAVAAPVSVATDADGVTLRAELPGVDPAAIAIGVEDRILTIRAERRVEKREGGRHQLAERRYGAFSQSLRLADDLDAEAISAKAENGVLTVRIPKRPEVKPRQIAVQVS